MIRPYGPGAYDHIIDQYVHEQALVEDRSIDLGDGSCYLFVESPLVEGYDGDLTEEEQGFLVAHEAAIVFVDGRANISVEYFVREDEAESRWAVLEALYDTGEEDEDD